MCDSASDSDDDISFPFKISPRIEEKRRWKGYFGYRIKQNHLQTIAKYWDCIFELRCGIVVSRGKEWTRRTMNIMSAPYINGTFSMIMGETVMALW